METTSLTSCSPYHDVIQDQPQTLVKKGKWCAFCAFLLRCALNVYLSVCVWEKTFSCQCTYRGMCAISTSEVLCTQNNATYQSHCSFSMPSASVPVLSKWYIFLNVYWNASASLPALKCSKTATTTTNYCAAGCLTLCTEIQKNPSHPQ